MTKKEMVCTSVADAKRRADELDITEGVRRFLDKVYGNKKAKCWFKKVGEEWLPFMTEFPGFKENHGELPKGEYLVTWVGSWLNPMASAFSDSVHGIRVAKITRDNSGSHSINYGIDSEERKEFAEQFGVWLPNKIELLTSLNSETDSGIM